MIFLTLLGVSVGNTYAGSDLHVLLESIENDAKTSQSYSNAVFRLSHPDNQLVLQIIQETKEISQLEDNQNYDAESDRLSDLKRAYDFAGTNLTPMLPQLKLEFSSGHNALASSYALTAIGGPAWPTLLEGLTSSNDKVQLCAVMAMPRAEGSNALYALAALSSLMTNQSPVVKLESIESVGQLRIGAKLRIPVLVREINEETDYTARCQAIKWLGRVGDRDPNVISVLKQAAKDKNEHVRFAATLSLRRIETGEE